MSKGFSIMEGSFGRFRTHTLLNNETGESATTVDDFAAQLQSLRFRGPDNKITEVIMSHASPEMMCELPTLAGAAPLIPFANYITQGRYTFKGKEYELETKVRRGSTRIAIHGFLTDKAWKLEETGIANDEASVTYGYIIGENDFKGYPFCLNLKHRLELSETFTSCVTAQNNGVDPLPLAMGFHPYLRVSNTDGKKIDGWELTMPSSRMMVRDSDNPVNFVAQEFRGTQFDFTKPRLIGSTTFSDRLWLFKAGERTMARLLNPEAGFGIDLWLGRGYEYMLLYTPSSPECYNRRGLSIEPMCAVPDAFNNRIGLTTLMPGESFKAVYSIRPSHVKL